MIATKQRNKNEKFDYSTSTISSFGLMSSLCSPVHSCFCIPSGLCCNPLRPTIPYGTDNEYYKVQRKEKNWINNLKILTNSGIMLFPLNH